MANSVRIVASVDDGISGSLDRIRDKFDTMGKGAASASLIGNVGAMALSAGVNMLGNAAGAAVDELGKSVQAASNLSESLSKSKVIFGDSSAQMEAFGNTAATSLGMSKQAAIEAGATMGNFFVGIGQSQPAAEKMSESMVGLAGDLASFNNLDPTEVLQKLRSGLTGAAEPLRSVGVFLTEAKVKAKAMEMGLADAHGELSEGAKVMARYAVILDETKTAQGDFARTSDGLANTQRTTAATIADAEAKMGEAWVPYAKNLESAKLAAIEFTTSGLEGWSMLGTAIEKFLGRTNDGFAVSAEEVEAATKKWAASVGEGAKGVEDGGHSIGMAVPKIAAGVKAATTAMQTDWEKSSMSAKLAVVDAMDKVGASVERARDRIKNATDAVINDSWDPIINAAEIKLAVIQVADDKIAASAAGLTEKEKAQADLQLANDQKRLNQLIADRGKFGSDAESLASASGIAEGAAYLTGMMSTDPAVSQHWADLLTEVTRAGLDQSRAAYTGGSETLVEMTRGMADNQGILDTALANVAGTFNGFDPDGFPIGRAWDASIAQGINDFGYLIDGAISNAVGSKMDGDSPPKGGPLRNIDKGGANIAEAWMDAFAGALDGGRLTSPLSGIADSLSGGVPALGGGGGVMAGGGPVRGGDVHIHIDRGAYIDGPSVDALARTIASRLNLVGIR